MTSLASMADDGDVEKVSVEQDSWYVATTKVLNKTLPFDLGNFIYFVPERSDLKEPANERCGGDGSLGQAFSGEEARQFYEDVIATPPLPKPKHKTKKPRHRRTRERLKKGTAVSKSFSSGSDSHGQINYKTGQRPFLCAQEGDTTALKALASSGQLDLDAVDEFGWTMLMCASCAGHTETVQYLLSLGADCTVKDKKGCTAIDLAVKNGHSSVEELISLSIFDSQRVKYKGTQDEEQTCLTPANKRVRYYCSICQQSVFDSTESRHSTSTVHQFCCQHHPKASSYGISQLNVGYQLMVRGGWDPDKGGLGPHSQGQRYPVRTVLKQDRLGLGLVSRSSKARVTHFGAFDEEAVKTANQRRFGEGAKKNVTKKELLKASEKERRFEIRMRRYMNTD